MVSPPSFGSSNTTAPSLLQSIAKKSRFFNQLSVRLKRELQNDKMLPKDALTLAWEAEWNSRVLK